MKTAVLLFIWITAPFAGDDGAGGPAAEGTAIMLIPGPEGDDVAGAPGPELSGIPSGFSAASMSSGEREEKLKEQMVFLAEKRLEEIWPDAEFQAEIRWIPSNLAERSPEELGQVFFDTEQLPRALTGAKVSTAGGDSFPVQFFIRTIAGLPVPRTNIEKNEMILESMIEMKQIDITRSRQLPLLEIEYRQLLAKRDLQAGSPLYPGDVQPVPVIDRGERVVMIYAGQGLRIDMNCEARRPGAAGEEITVQCSETGKRYRVEIEKEQTVRWKQTL